jgi:glycosyltransferase involved in cell wall biosynthesis
MSAPVRTVGFNAMFLDPGVSGGPETYLRQLGEALVREHPQLRLEVATTRRGAAALRADGWEEWAGLRELPADEGERARRTLAEQVLLPRLARRGRWDVMHSLASVAPIRSPVPSVITVHDVTFMKVRTFSRVTTWGMAHVITRASRRADALITDSAASRDDVAEALGVDPAHITVVPLGPGRPPEDQPTDEQLLRDRYALDGRRVVLCVAAKRPHKNQEVLVRAAAHLGSEWAIVLAGHPEPYEAELRRLAADLGTEDRLRFVDHVTDVELEGLTRLAGCIAVPTLGEGFGLPVLEAMRRGVPVACSDIPVLHEVGGDAACYFDPRDPAAAAAAIEATYGAPDLAAAGLARAEGFSWEATARATFEAYERAVANRKRR